MLKSNQKSNLSIKTSAPAKKIYMDYAASVLPNPSSIHILGVLEKRKLEKARQEVATILGTLPQNIIFNSGGTESNNLAIQGVVFAWHENNIRKIPHIITTNIEHPSVLETCKLLQKRKLAEISIIPVEENGIVDPKKIRKEIKENTVLVSVMYANNEIGTIQPIREIAKEIRHYKKMRNSAEFSRVLGLGPDQLENSLNFSSSTFPIFHTDAVQAVNYLDLNVEKLGVDLLSLSGTKIENSGRIGILFKKKNIQLVNIFGGGDQESGLRPGTENVIDIVKFSNALKVVEKNKEKENKRLIKLRNYFIEKLEKQSVILNGSLENRLPNNINITFPKIPSDLLVVELSERGIMTSSKSACKSSNSDGSYVVKAIHPEIGKDIGGLRFSMGKNTTKKEIDITLRALTEILKKLKKWYD